MQKISLATALFLTTFANIAAANTYTMDPKHTFVTFEIPHMATSTNRGRFDRKEGTVEYDRAAKTGKVKFTLYPDSITTGTPILDKIISGNEVFDTAKFPTVQFVSDKFTFSGDKITEVSGQLTMLGKTLPVVLKSTLFNCYQNGMLKKEVCGGDFETWIKRSDWGVTYALNYGFADTIRLLIQVEAIKD
ncbi:MAG: YceI family protein [Pseudomonadota bacterium]